MKTSLKRSGFTLVELLVVITIIAVLAGVVFTVARNMKERAASSRRLSEVRQVGAILLSLASETNGRCQYFSGGSGGFEFRPYFMIMRELGIDNTNGKGVVDVMHWDRIKMPPAITHWNCRAVNFKNVPDFNAVWTTVSVKDAQGRSANVSSLTIGSVTRPSAYPLLIDSSTSSGEEIFRINESGGDCVGMREPGKKTNAYMLDGSARSMDRTELKAAGFSKAYDNLTKPPKSITL